MAVTTRILPAPPTPKMVFLHSDGIHHKNPASNSQPQDGVPPFRWQSPQESCQHLRPPRWCHSILMAVTTRILPAPPNPRMVSLHSDGSYHKNPASTSHHQAGVPPFRWQSPQESCQHFPPPRWCNSILMAVTTRILPAPPTPKMISLHAPGSHHKNPASTTHP